MNAARSPSPWTEHRGRAPIAPRRVFRDRDGGIVCVLESGCTDANAVVLLAAPELLAQLEEVTGALKSTCFVITDDVARAIALLMVREAEALLRRAGGAA